METRSGALPAQILRAYMEAGHIQNAQSEHVSPASLDLTLSDEVYKISGLLLPRPGETIASLLTLMGAVVHDISTPLRCDELYLVRLNESLALPSHVYGYCNPKSSTGRLDMHVRVLADGVPRYDSVTPKGYTGSLWLAIHPKSFAVLLHPGTPLTQLRLFTADTRLSESELAAAIRDHSLVWHETEDRPLRYEELLTHDQDGALILTAMISDGVCGYVCIAEPSEILDVAKVGGYAATDFFKPIYAHDGVLRLHEARRR